MPLMTGRRRSARRLTGGGKAAITGDFVLIATEVNPVLRALREHGIEVTAIHNHMLDDQPHLFFITSGPMTTPKSSPKG